MMAADMKKTAKVLDMNSFLKSRTYKVQVVLGLPSGSWK